MMKILLVKDKVDSKDIAKQKEKNSKRYPVLSPILKKK